MGPRAGAASRRLLRAVAGALVLVGAGCGSAGTSDKEPAAATAARLEPDCPTATTSPKITADLVNKVVSSSDLPAWQAGDIGASARLSDGRLVWVFGDTVRTGDFSPRIVANSMLVSSGSCVSQLRVRGNGPVIPDVSNDVVRWPMSVVVLPPVGPAAGTGVQDVLVVLCARTQRGGSGGDLDFTFLGTSAAVFTVAADGVPELQEVIEITPDDTATDQVNWGAAATVHGKWYYVYGTRLPDQQGVFGRELYAARVPVDDPGNRDKWRFWDGSRWQPAIGSAALTLPAVGGVSQTLSVSVVDGVFVAVSKRDGDLGDLVYSWTSTTPAGPWTPHQGVSAPSGVDSGNLQYAPLAHPEVPLTDGKLLVSISRNTTDLQQLMDDPEVGRPLFVEVARP
ncbi:MAG TPA: hypothetical protein VFV89_11730 [Nocardioides sp.]|uniref:hypothetical protein n=1 Tax=Nocardioides sp. TaxID=35761 RepID=UPI002E34704E|nr:hypothetical protein [Nocardioides sp.]HEX5088470.1 hypothetical protein [Nocardioides sp.]